MCQSMHLNVTQGRDFSESWGFSGILGILTIMRILRILRILKILRYLRILRYNHQSLLPNEAPQTSKHTSN